MNQELLQNGVRLYYRILKAHRKHLPGALRKLGDIYVKQEFRQHHSDPNEHYYPKFYDQWSLYLKQLEQGGFQSVAKPIDPSTESLLTQDQKEALKNLESGVKKIKDWILIQTFIGYKFR